MGAGSVQNGCADAADHIRPKFTLCGPFALATRRITSAPFAPALAPLLLDLLMLAFKGHWLGYLLPLALLFILLLIVCMQ
jgi:hypothetical protein